MLTEQWWWIKQFWLPHSGLFYSLVSSLHSPTGLVCDQSVSAAYFPSQPTFLGQKLHFFILCTHATDMHHTTLCMQMRKLYCLQEFSYYFSILFSYYFLFYRHFTIYILHCIDYYGIISFLLHFLINVHHFQVNVHWFYLSFSLCIAYVRWFYHFTFSISIAFDFLSLLIDVYLSYYSFSFILSIFDHG